MGGGAREERGQSFPFHPSGVMKGRAEEGGHCLHGWKKRKIQKYL